MGGGGEAEAKAETEAEGSAGKDQGRTGGAATAAANALIDTLNTLRTIDFQLNTFQPNATPHATNVKRTMNGGLERHKI